MAAIDGFQQCLIPGQLAAAHEEQAIRRQRVPEQVDGASLTGIGEVDEQVAARHKIDPEKRRVTQHVVRRENDVLSGDVRHHNRIFDMAK